MKTLSLLLIIAALSGCAGASPIDFLIPTRKPTPATEEYLGHLYSTNNVNRMYHSLSDTKFEKALVPLRKAELEGLAMVAKGELDFIDAVGTMASNGVYGAIVAVAGMVGLNLPRPKEKALIAEALNKKATAEDLTHKARMFCVSTVKKTFTY